MGRRPYDIRAAVARQVLPGLLLAVLAGCGANPAPEDALREWVRDAAAAVENEDRGALLEMIAAGYADARGNERADIDQALRGYFLRSSSIGVVTSISDVAIMGDTAATVSLTAAITGTNDRLFGLSAEGYGFELELEHDGGAWKLVSARWAELGSEPR